jgi:hypothetical protein
MGDLMRDETLLLVLAMLCITILEILALCFYHIDGVILSSVVFVLTAIATKRENALSYIEKKLLK